jgi:fibronectin type 3 domain-containing protein
MRKGAIIGQLSLWLALLCLLAVPHPAGGQPALRPGGFEGDGYADLVVGVPGEDVDGEVSLQQSAGAVHILSGYAGGLVPRNDELWHQDRGRPGVADSADDQERFGWALATGDLNGDGYADLAIGVLREEVNSQDNGAVNVLYGSSSGLTVTGNQFWHQSSVDVVGAAEYDDSFGYALAIGDFDGDGYDDLAIGVPGEAPDDENQIWEAGGVNVLYGASSGLTASGNQFWDQDCSGMQGWGAERFDNFGQALAAADFDGDGYDDLAVGVKESFGNGQGASELLDAGAVNVLYGSSAGLIITGNEFWHQDVPGVGGMAEAGDRFGQSLAAGDFDRDGYGDLAVGVPSEDVGDLLSAGAVNIFYGSVDGLTARGEAPWHQDSPGVDDLAEADDQFGLALAAGDLNGDGFDELAVGVPGEGVQDETYGDVSGAGAVNTLYGSSSGLTATNEPIWHQGRPNVAGAPEQDDYFGASLASGDLNGDGYDDLAVGVPYEDIGTIKDAGGVNVLYGSSAGLTATGEAVWHQSQPGVEEAPGEDDLFGWSLAIADWYGEALPAPGNVQASDGTYTDKVRVTWDSVPGASSYTIYWSDSETGNRWVLGTISGTAYDNTSAGPGILHYYWIAACEESRCSDYSNHDIGYRALLPPGSVSASDGTHPDRVRITWNAVTGATSYNVWWAASATGPRWMLGISTNTVYDHTYTSPGPDIPQYYWVVACNGPRCSGLSDHDSGYRGCDPPAAPDGLEATDGRLRDKVQLTWTGVAGAVKYEVYRAPSLEGERTMLGEVTSASYDDTSAVPDTTYYYWVTACDSCGCSDLSTYDTGFRGGACADPPTPPSNVQASDGTYVGKVQVTWGAVAGADEYELFRSDSATGVKRLLGYATGTSFGDATAAPATTYHYWVKACSESCGCGDFGNSDTGYRSCDPPAAPSNLQASDGLYSDEVRLTWNSVSNTDHYEVYRATSAEGEKAKLGEPSSAAYDDTTASPGTTYHYWVTACSDACGCSGVSSQDTGYRTILRKEATYLPITLRGFR